MKLAVVPPPMMACHWPGPWSNICMRSIPAARFLLPIIMSSTPLAGRLTGSAVMPVKVREWQGKIVFLHEVIEGAADRSYGIHVARLAGIPHDVLLSRAEQVLASLVEENAPISAFVVDDLPLLSCKTRLLHLYRLMLTASLVKRLMTSRPIQ